MAPSFFIVGFQKCGTTSLYDMLMQHPKVIPGLIKENNILAQKADRLEEFKLCFPLKQQGKITGDASHLHTWMPWGLERIKKHYPNAKLIVIMRDPVKRAFSHFNMDQKIGYIPKELTFDQYFDIEMTLRESINYDSNIEEIYSQTKFYGNQYGWVLSRGIYANYIEKIQELGIDYLPMFVEELNAKFDQQSRQVQEYLNLPYSDLAKNVSNSGKYQMVWSEDTISRVEAFYEPHNQRLESLIQRPLTWI